MIQVLAHGWTNVSARYIVVKPICPVQRVPGFRPHRHRERRRVPHPYRNGGLFVDHGQVHSPRQGRLGIAIDHVNRPGILVAIRVSVPTPLTGDE